MIINPVDKVSDEMREKIRSLSAYSLPTNPSERGMTPEQIKARFYMPILGASYSVIAELERVIEALNGAFATLNLLFSGESVETGEDEKALEDLIWLEAQEMTLKEFTARIEDIRQNADRASSFAQEAQEARDGAERAETGANEAKEGAETARDNILSMSVSSVVVPYSDVPSVSKTEVGGTVNLVFRLPVGKPFSVARIYSSVDEMNAGYENDGVKVNEYVMIDTGNVENEENAQLYIKGTTAYSFIADLSGATGIKPVRGVDYFTPEDYAYFESHIDNYIDEGLGDVSAALDELHSYAVSLADGGDEL